MQGKALTTWTKVNPEVSEEYFPKENGACNTHFHNNADNNDDDKEDNQQTKTKLGPASCFD